MTAEAKLRTLAQQSAELVAWFGTSGSGVFRWFDRRLPPNYLKQGASCMRVTRIGTTPLYSHETRGNQGQVNQVPIRFQLDVLDFEAERAREAAAAVKEWLASSDFSSNSQFASPTTSPKRHPNFVLNHRVGMEPRTEPPAFVESIDVRIWNLEE